MYWLRFWLFVPLVSAAEDACSVQPWNDTKCCNDRPEVGAVSEGMLSVTECNSSTVEGINSVSLEWHHSTLEEDGEILRRIFLFSHCINPTNTSMAPSLGTLLYSADRTHRASYTTISHPAISACSYFGCYEGCYGNCIYTFSVVSCPATLSSVVSSPVLYVIETTELDMAISISPTLQSHHHTSSVHIKSSIMYSLSSLHWVSPTQTSEPIHDYTVEGASMWSWLVPLIILLLVIGIATGLLIIIIIISYTKRSNDLLKSVSWHGDSAETNSSAVKYRPWNTFKESDSLSVHTLYADIDDTSIHKVIQTANYDTSESSVTPDTPPDDVTNGESDKCEYQTSSSGVSTCSYIDTFDEHSDSTDCTTITDNRIISSYITDNSLNTYYGSLSDNHQVSGNCSSSISNTDASSCST